MIGYSWIHRIVPTRASMAATSPRVEQEYREPAVRLEGCGAGVDRERRRDVLQELIAEHVQFLLAGADECLPEEAARAPVVAADERVDLPLEVRGADVQAIAPYEGRSAHRSA